LKNKYIIIWRICINVLRIEVDTPETMTVGIGVDINSTAVFEISASVIIQKRGRSNTPTIIDIIRQTIVGPISVGKRIGRRTGRIVIHDTATIVSYVIGKCVSGICKRQ
jgi:hypothetical protein